MGANYTHIIPPMRRAKPSGAGYAETARTNVSPPLLGPFFVMFRKISQNLTFFAILWRILSHHGIFYRYFSIFIDLGWILEGFGEGLERIVRLVFAFLLKMPIL